MLTPDREAEIRRKLQEVRDAFLAYDTDHSQRNLERIKDAKWPLGAEVARDLLAEVDRLRGQVKAITDAVDHWEPRAEYDSIKVYALITDIRDILLEPRNVDA